MNDRQPWFHAYLKFPYLALLAGLLLLLSSVGNLKLGVFEFTPTADGSLDIRFFLANAGLILMLLGAALILNNEGIWKSKIGGLYFVTSLVVLGGVGFVTSNRDVESPPVSYRELRLFNNWDVTEERFFSQVATRNLAPLKAGNVLLLLCRKFNPSVEFEADPHIQKSKRFEIRPEEPLQSIAVEFSPEFSGRLNDRDLVECGLAVVPASAQVDDIHVPSNVNGLGGQLLGFASDDIAAPRGDGPPGT